ncbi:RT0821/Lpp0805 family surface protein [Teichococcus coralli]|nr:RT0821/Lpp0805 family surface protein [Pseudoroseomonas coralli]
MPIMPALVLSVVAAGGFTHAQWRAPSPSSTPLTRSDLDQQSAAASRLLRATPPPLGRNESWKNPATGRSGNITLLEAFSDQGRPCRRLQFEVSALGEANQYVLKLCRVGDGNWKIAE